MYLHYWHALVSFEWFSVGLGKSSIWDRYLQGHGQELFRRGHGIKNLAYLSWQKKCWDFRPVKMVKLGTFSMTSYTLSHLFQSLFFIHITLRIFSLCKSLKATHINFQSQTQIWNTNYILGRSNQKYICHLNNCLSDLFHLGTQK